MEQEQMTMLKDEDKNLLEKTERLKKLENPKEETDVIVQLKSSLEDLRHGRIKRLA